MNLTHQRTSALFFALTLLCMLMLIACQSSETSPPDDRSETPTPLNQLVTSPLNEQDEQRTLNSFLIESDFPAGWFRSYSGVDEIESDLIYATDFLATDQPGLDYIGVTQRLIIYADEAQAREFYQEKWAQSGPDLVYGQVPAEISYRSRADDFKIGCLYSTTALQPENFCAAVARYDRLISVLTVKTWDEDDAEHWFTWADFERALEAMDRRALEAAGR